MKKVRSNQARHCCIELSQSFFPVSFFNEKNTTAKSLEDHCSVVIYQQRIEFFNN